jgi:adenylate cyclase
MKARWLAVLAGVTVGAISAALLAVPAIRSTEQQFGLRWLFQLRGPVEPPADIALVLINQQAADSLSLPRDGESFYRCEGLQIGARPATHVSVPAMPSRWPRCLHARLLRALQAAGAELVVFDVLFRERPPLPGKDGDMHAWQDQEFAAVASQGRVLIAQKIEGGGKGDEETLVAVSPVIANAVLGSAPFPVIVDASRRVDRFMAFKEEGYVTPTLPAIAVQAQAMDGYPAIRELLVAHDGEVGPLLPSTSNEILAQRQLQATSLLIRQIVRRDRTLIKRLAAAVAASPGSGTTPSASERSLIALYSGSGTRILNLYGPSGTIPAIGYDQVLGASPQANAARFRDRIVFVGYGETEELEQIEHFATAYSSDDRADLSGVEIAVTAFANLRDDQALRELPFIYWLALTFLAGSLAYMACDQFGNRLAIAIVAAGVVAYAVASLYLFQSRQLWVPFVIPLFVAAPFGMLSSFGWKFWTAHRQRAHLRRAISYFVPREVVATLERNAGNIGTSQETTDCACVATDAANFTPLAETMTPEALTRFLNHYFEALFGHVADRGGFVSDVVGDAMLAIWPHRSEDTHVRLLHALLEMSDSAQQFNEQLAGNRWLTRFGVDWGRVTLSTVGAHGHYEYRAVGDAVNTATRIQELNKKLGTRILVSESAIGDCGAPFLLRDVGRFMLRGKSHAIHVFELFDDRARAQQWELELCDRFGEALGTLAQGDLEQAQLRFRAIQETFPDDGPTRFYLKCLAGEVVAHEGAWVVA